MRKLLAPLALATALAVGGATTATAAKPAVQFAIGPKATLLPNTGLNPPDSSIRVPVTVSCPVTFLGVFIVVDVSQASNQGEGSAHADCFGAPINFDIHVISLTGAPWALGQAVAVGTTHAGPGGCLIRPCLFAGASRLGRWRRSATVTRTPAGGVRAARLAPV